MKIVLETKDGHRIVVDSGGVGDADVECNVLLCAIAPNIMIMAGEPTVGLRRLRKYERTGEIATVTPIVAIDLPVFKEVCDTE